MLRRDLTELEIDARIDHSSLEAQGIALEPQTQIGAPAHCRVEWDSAAYQIMLFVNERSR